MTAGRTGVTERKDHDRAGDRRTGSQSGEPHQRRRQAPQALARGVTRRHLRPAWRGGPELLLLHLRRSLPLRHQCARGGVRRIDRGQVVRGVGIAAFGGTLEGGPRLGHLAALGEERAQIARRRRVTPLISP